MSDQDLILIDDSAEALYSSDYKPWLILVVDDEEDVHTLTKTVITDIKFQDRGIKLLHAKSAKEASEILAVTSDIAVILLDVVMETDHAGLQLVRKVREEFCNSTVRIVLRTGQPGIAPERQVITDWDINEYLPKAELTANRLFSSVISSLRAYHHLEQLIRTQAELENYQMTLELKVQERTESLARSNRRLEAEIAKKLKVEAAIRERERDLRQLLEGSSIGITILSNTGIRLYVNSRYLTLWSLDKTEAQIGRMAIPEFEAFGPDWLKQAFEGKNREFEHFLTRPQQEGWWSLNSIEMVTFEGNAAAILWCYDATERKQAEFLLKETADNLEARLLQSRKMEAIGTLAGGIAHDFNNILATVMGSAEMALDITDTNERNHRYITNILKASHHAKNLVQQLLTFARPMKAGEEPVSLVQATEEAFALLTPTFPEDLVIEQSFNDCDALILADKTQINQIINNLCRNAVDAMREHKEKQQEQGIETSQIAPMRLLTTISKVNLDSLVPFGEKLLDPGSYIQLVVADNGHGMDAKTAARIFDPFFSTKRAGNGTGLGLSMVHGLITAHNGAITVTSEPGQGATFRVLFPIWEGHVPQKPSPSDQVIQHGNQQTILLIEDEVRLLESACDQITSLGYICHTVHNAEQGLERILSGDHHYDLVICDHVLPGMSGATFASILSESKKPLPIMLLTGYEPSILKNVIKEGSIQAIFAKPIKKRELAVSIANILSGNIKTDLYETDSA